MKHGLFYQLPCHSHQSMVRRYEETLREIEIAEDLGFDSVWLGEIHFDATLGSMPSILVMAAAIAQRTRRMRIGMGVSLLPLRNPILTAEEASMVDALSGGRLDFGVGRGVLTFYDGLMIPPEESRQRFSESLDIILKAWTNDSFSHEGDYHSIREASVVPRPVQKPYPPITLAASGSPGVFEFAAGRSFEVMSGLFITPLDKLREQVENYRAAETDAGRDPRPAFLKLLQPAFIAETVGEARGIAEASVNSYFDAVKDILESPAGERTIAAVPEYRKFKDARDEHTFEHLVKTEVDLHVTPAVVVARLQRLKKELPLDEVFYWFEMGGLIPHEKLVKSMRLFAEEVMPYLS